MLATDWEKSLALSRSFVLNCKRKHLSIDALASLVDRMDNPRPVQATIKSSEPLPSYRAYMVRCWQENRKMPEDEPIWRFSLDAPWYEERVGFANLQALVEHLQTELMRQDASPSHE